jgi:rhodanese-related sulfurtransferase
MSSEDAHLVGLREAGDVDVGKIAAAERLVVVGEVAKEVDLLETPRRVPGRRRLSSSSCASVRSCPTRKARRHMSPMTSAEP